VPARLHKCPAVALAYGQQACRPCVAIRQGCGQTRMQARGMHVQARAHVNSMIRTKKPAGTREGFCKRRQTHKKIAMRRAASFKTG